MENIGKTEAKYDTIPISVIPLKLISTNYV